MIIKNVVETETVVCNRCRRGDKVLCKRRILYEDIDLPRSIMHQGVADLCLNCSGEVYAKVLKAIREGSFQGEPEDK